MSRILFLQDFWFEYLGSIYIAEMLLNSNHQVDVIVDADLKSIVQKAIKQNPDIIACSCTTGTHQWVEELTRLIKKANPKILTIIGGPHPTFFPEMIEEEGVDIICRGEGDDTIIDLVNAYFNGGDIKRIPNLWVKKDNEIYRNDVRDLIKDLDTLPFNKRRLYKDVKLLRESPSKHFITGRGCPYHCSFCFNHKNMELYKGKGTYIRKHSPERIIEEIRYVSKNYGLKSVRFDDDLFIINPKWLFEFLDMYAREINLPYFCTVRANLITDDVAEALGKSGCTSAYFGIESGNDFLRNEVLCKGISKEQIIFAAATLKKHGVKVGTFNMLALPGETVDNAFETIHLNQKIKGEYVWVSLVQPYPRTGLAEYALKHDFLDNAPKEDATDNNEKLAIDRIHSSYFKKSVLKNKQARELENLHKLFFLAVKYPSLEKLIRWLIRFKPNPIFNLLFYFFYTKRYMKTYHMPFWRVLLTGLRSKTHTSSSK